MTTCFILAAGNAERHNGGNKPLLEVNGETLLHRTCRLSFGYSNGTHVGWFVSHILGRYDYGYGYCQLEPKNHRWITETLLSTHGFWSDERDTIALLGDVFYTNAAMEKIMESKGTIAFGKGYNIHAFKWTPKFNQTIKEQLERYVFETEAKPRTHGAGKLWRFVETQGIHLVDFGDETTDFDSPQEHQRFIAKYGNRSTNKTD